MFASAATPIVRIRPAKPGQRERHAEQQDRAVHERRVDREAEHRDDAEEAVEASRKTATSIRPAIAALRACAQRVLAERRRDVGALDRHELDRQRAGLEHEREVASPRRRREPGDLGAAAGRVDAVGVLRVVDRAGTSRSGRRARSRSAAATPSARPRMRLVARDLVEELVALAGELQRHDRLAARRVEVLPACP